MGINPKNLNDKQIGLIKDPAQQRAVVKARGFDTQKKIDAKNEAQTEKDLHDKYAGFLRRHNIAYIHASMVKKSTIQKGAPDFTVTPGERYAYKSFYGEFKVRPNKLSLEQLDYIVFLNKCGCKVFVWYDYETAMHDTAEFLGIDLHQERC
jgi:hypothetical protein